MPISDFILPESSIATSPCEERGIPRDHTRLLVSSVSNDKYVRVKFYNIVEFLKPGDLLVINTSATIPTTLIAVNKNGLRLKLRLSQKVQFNLWLIDLIVDDGDLPELVIGEFLNIPDNGRCVLVSPYQEPYAKDSQYWLASFETSQPFLEFLHKHALPVRFSHHSKQWSIEYFQTIFANEPGSAEMPSAGRGFTNEIITKLISNRVQVIPILLHAGTNSEGHVPPHEEYYDVSLDTAQVINIARKSNRRIIAIGSTVVRALETVTDINNETHPGQGWTKKIIAPTDKIKSVNGLLTSLHSPNSTHIDIIKNFCSEEHLYRAYTDALKEGFLWDEFGDFHLILP